MANWGNLRKKKCPSPFVDCIIPSNYVDWILPGLDVEATDNEAEDADIRDKEQQLHDCVDDDGFRRVRGLSINIFRQLLIEHFDIEFKANQVKWPSTLNNNK